MIIHHSAPLQLLRISETYWCGTMLDLLQTNQGFQNILPNLPYGSLLDAQIDKKIKELI